MLDRIDRRWRGTSAHACIALRMPSVSLRVRKHANNTQLVARMQVARRSGVDRIRLCPWVPPRQATTWVYPLASMPIPCPRGLECIDRCRRARLIRC